MPTLAHLFLFLRSEVILDIECLSDLLRLLTCRVHRVHADTKQVIQSHESTIGVYGLGGVFF